MTERELLTAGLRELGVAECPFAADNLLRYSEILREKNKVMNLTAITDPTEIVTRHFLDCAALAPYMPQNGRVLDVGTGAGFPGMPLAILCPAGRVCAARCTGASALIFSMKSSPSWA